MTDLTPQNLTRSVLDEYAEEEWPLADFLALLEDAIANIPETQRGGAKVSLSGSYDSSGRLEIQYSDVETPVEVAQRLARREASVREEEARERRQFERLKAKFGGRP